MAVCPDIIDISDTDESPENSSGTRITQIKMAGETGLEPAAYGFGDYSPAQNAIILNLSIGKFDYY